MIISVNWLKKFTDIDLPIDDLAKLIGSRLVEIESITNISEKYKDAVIVKVVECEKMDGTDHLSLVKIDAGPNPLFAKYYLPSTNLVQVICGAPNVHTDMLAVWLPPESIVPSSFEGSEPFVLTAKDLRGTISNGMLASPKELDLFDYHEGILEIDKEVEPGTSFALTYELDDSLLDIENKSLTHRPDTFGIIGFAREVAAIQGKKFVTPDWLIDTEVEYDESTSTDEAPSITIDDAELSARYQVVVLNQADGSRQSPLQIQTYLSRVGVRPVNAIVDVTNYLMMLTGQPLHAFDYDKLIALSGGKSDIHVRAAKDGEKLELLDGRKISMSNEDIVISSGEVAVGLAGAMGGASTVIDKSTKNIILESATFNLFNLRATQMRHGVFSEAITRFTKGQPPELSSPVLADAIRLMGEWAGAKQASQVAVADGEDRPSEAISFNASQVNSILGTNLTIDEIESTLKLVEFASAKLDKLTLSVSPPYWRADIHQVEDVVEEIGRLRGFDSINPTLPERDFTAMSPVQFDILRTKLRKTLVRAGANEILSYSFIHGDTIKNAGQNIEDSYRLTNSLSPELQYYRQSLTPSLLQTVRPNIKNGFDDFAVFELNKAHPKQRGVNIEKVPDEADSIALTIVSKTSQRGAPYYRAKKFLDFLAKSCGLSLQYLPIEEDIKYPTFAPFEYRRSAIVIDTKSNEQLGVVGEYKKSVVKGFKLPEYVAGFELDMNALFTAVQTEVGQYKAISKYPSTERDICFQVKNDVTFDNIVNSINKSFESEKIEYMISPIDIYQPDNESAKNITVRITLNARDHTMTSEEIARIMSAVINHVVSKVGAKII